MNDVNRSIFRTDAIRRYVQTREEPVLPRLVSPRTFICLWILLGLLVAGGLAAWLARVPVYASGPALVVSLEQEAEYTGTEIVVVALLPPHFLSRLQAGQTMSLHFGAAGERLTMPLVAVEPEISSPEAVQRRFVLSAGAASAVTQPAVVAMAQLEPFLAGLPASTYVGSVYRADVEVGSRRVISLFPLIGRLFGE